MIAVDRTTFPSDTVSTHLFFPSHYAELARLGALERVEALGAPHHRQGGLHAKGIAVQGTYKRAGGPRVRGLRAATRPGHGPGRNGARSRCGGTGADDRHRRDPRTRRAGKRRPVARSRRGRRDDLATLVIGADGRRSSMAERFGSRVHHSWPNGRMMAFAYYEDAGDEAERAVATQWRAGRELGTIFPCDGGQLVALVMPPAERAAEFRADPQAAFERAVTALPLMAERLNGCTRETKVRTSYEHQPFFRTSSGPGWALVGDAGHFKDPVIAQGIRDALRFGRLLGEAAAPALDEPARLDAALWRWERNRDDECLDSYQFGNRWALVTRLAGRGGGLPLPRARLPRAGGARRLRPPADLGTPLLARQRRTLDGRRAAPPGCRSPRCGTCHGARSRARGGARARVARLPAPARPGPRGVDRLAAGRAEGAAPEPGDQRRHTGEGERCQEHDRGPGVVDYGAGKAGPGGQAALVGGAEPRGRLSRGARRRDVVDQRQADAVHRRDEDAGQTGQQAEDRDRARRRQRRREQRHQRDQGA